MTAFFCLVVAAIASLPGKGVPQLGPPAVPGGKPPDSMLEMGHAAQSFASLDLSTAGYSGNGHVADTKELITEETQLFDAAKNLDGAQQSLTESAEKEPVGKVMAIPQLDPSVL